MSADKFEPVIGLEVHCQLATRTKLFCGCSTEFGAEANAQTCPVCLGYPGALPTLNQKAVDYALMLGKAVQGEIHPISVFARKQYFYPDLPKGYQISQFDKPYSEGGQVPTESGGHVLLERIHLEEDAGKTIHAGESSYIDLNRAGTPLLEIVTKPVISSPTQAIEYLKSLRGIVRFLGISDGNLEEGSFRCDVNISVRIKGSKLLNTRCEIKNLNSFRNVEKAIQYEFLRQVDVVCSGETLKQQTLLYDPAEGKTRPMRTKENANDYRYFPDPDLPPLVIRPEHLNKCDLPELPLERKARYQESYGISDDAAQFLTSEPTIAGYFETALGMLDQPSLVLSLANWMQTDLMRYSNEGRFHFEHPLPQAQAFADLVSMIGRGEISGKQGKLVLESIIGNDQPVHVIVDRLGLSQISDEKEIRKIAEKIIHENPEQVAQYRAGKDKVFGFFVGQAMKASGGKMNPAILNKLLRELLDESP